MRTTHKKPTKKESTYSHTAAKAGIVGALALLVVYFGVQTSTGRMSPEVGFTDVAPSGLKILPASGASDVSQPCPYALQRTNDLTPTSDNGGYILPNNLNNMEVDAQGLDFCVDDNGPYKFFVPVHSAAELQSFYNAANGTGNAPLNAYQVGVFQP